MAKTDLVVRLMGDASNLNKALAGVGNDMTRTGAKLTRTLTPAAAAVGLAMGKMGSDFNDARDAIIKGTGASGAALDGLLNDTKKVAGQVPQDFGTVGVAIAELNTRLGLTGEELQDVARQALDFSRVTGVDVERAVRTVSRTMGDWGIETENASDVMDLLFTASQQTGIGVDTLGDKLVQFGAPLRQVGFSMEEATALLAGFEAEGVNTEQVMSGLRQSLGRMAQAGEEPTEAFSRLSDEIKNAGSAGEANILAIELFGSRAGPDMAAAIREGRFEIDDMVASLSDSGGAVEDAADRTLRFSDRLSILRNRITGVLGPFGELGGVIGGAAASLGPLLFGLGQMAPLLGRVRTAFRALTATMAANPFAAAAIAITAVVTALVVFGTRSNEVSQRAKDMASAINEAESAFDALNDAVNASITSTPELARALDAAQLTADDLTAALDAGGSELNEFADALLDGADAAGLNLGEMGKLGRELNELADSWEEGSDLAEVHGRVLADTADEADGLAGEFDDLTDSIDDGTDATDRASRATLSKSEADEIAARKIDEHNQALDEQRRKLDDVMNASMSLIDTRWRHRDAEEATAKAVWIAVASQNDAETSAHDLELAYRDVESSTLAQAAAAVQLAENTAEAEGKTVSQTEKALIQAEVFREVAETLAPDNPLRARLMGYADELGNIPSEVRTTLGVDTASALADIQRVRDRLGGLKVGDLNLPRVDDLQRKSGGPIPGSKNQAVPITAHGGEYVLDAGTVDAIKKGQPSAGKNTGGPAMGEAGGSRVGVHIEHATFNDEADVDALMRAVNLHMVGA